MPIHNAGVIMNKLRSKLILVTCSLALASGGWWPLLLTRMLLCLAATSLAQT